MGYGRAKGAVPNRSKSFSHGRIGAHSLKNVRDRVLGRGLNGKGQARLDAAIIRDTKESE